MNRSLRSQSGPSHLSILAIRSSNGHLESVLDSFDRNVLLTVDKLFDRYFCTMSELEHSMRKDLERDDALSPPMRAEDTQSNRDERAFAPGHRSPRTVFACLAIPIASDA
jgi:hypothetical protein